ncbi:hypothetical protein NQZ68_026787, partial [Dissostichus eleginoides]
MGWSNQNLFPVPEFSERHRVRVTDVCSVFTRRLLDTLQTETLMLSVMRICSQLSECSRERLGISRKLFFYTDLVLTADGAHEKKLSNSKQQREESPEPSCVSLKSDRSKGALIGFKDGRPSNDPVSQQQREKSPGPSCVSMKSDRSKRALITFKDGSCSYDLV